jgi:hypothetical protein
MEGGIGMSEKKVPPSVIAIGLFDGSGHLTPAVLEALRGGKLCDEELTAALTHMGGCEKCAEAFASGFDDNGLAPVPAGFGEEVKKKAKSKDEGSHSFALYVFKVALAACIALIITFSSAFNTLVSKSGEVNEVKAPSFNFVNSISEQLDVFSQNVINMEVFNNAPKKK